MWAAIWAAESSPNAPAAPKPVGRHVTQDISKWDANRNGRLDGEEQAAFRRDRIREHQTELDTRAKAAVEVRKFDEAARRTRMMPPAKLKQYDTNGNGLMDADEWKAYRKDVDRLTAERRAARLGAATNAAAPPTHVGGYVSSSAVSTNSP
ncbi:MAG TPA: hypothetical protein VI136_04270 [Verrucomicrobiae bacterium]